MNEARPPARHYVNGSNRQGRVVLSQGMRALYEDPALAPRIARFREAVDPLDCLEELALARALLEEFLASYQAQNAWGKAWQQAKVEETNAPPPPVRWLTLDEALKFIKVIGDLTRGIGAMRAGESMSKAEVKFKIYQLAQAVEQAVQSQAVEEGWKEALLHTIKEKWLGIWI